MPFESFEIYSRRARGWNEINIQACGALGAFLIYGWNQHKNAELMAYMALAKEFLLLFVEYLLFVDARFNTSAEPLNWSVN